MTDIKLTKGEITLGNGDLELIEGGACVVQNLITRLSTDKGALFYAPDFGEGLLRFLHSPADEKTILDLEGALSEALRTQPYVIAKSANVKVTARGGVLNAELYFTVEGGEQVSLFLSWGNEFTWGVQGGNRDV